MARVERVKAMLGRLSTGTRTRRGRFVLSGVAVLLVAAILGLAFAVVGNQPAKTANGVSTRGAAVSVTTTTTTVPEGNPSAPAGTEAPAQTVQTAAQAVVSTVQGGIADAAIRRGAGHLLIDLVTPLTGKPYDHTREVQRFNVLAQTVYKDLTRGAIKGTATTDALASGVATLAFALGTPVPYPSLTTTTVHPPPKPAHKAKKAHSPRKALSKQKGHSPRRNPPPPKRTNRTGPEQSSTTVPKQKGAAPSTTSAPRRRSSPWSR